MESSSSNILISVESLASKLFEGEDHTLKTDIPSNLKIIDSSAGGEKALNGFKEKAIPTARFLNIVKDLKDKESKYPNTFPGENDVKEVSHIF